jgi:hypothetical protein
MPDSLDTVDCNGLPDSCPGPALFCTYGAPYTVYECIEGWWDCVVRLDP